MPLKPEQLAKLKEDLEIANRAVAEESTRNAEDPGPIVPGNLLQSRAQRMYDMLSDPRITKIRPVEGSTENISEIFYDDGTSRRIPEQEMGQYLWMYSPDLVGVEKAGDEKDLLRFADGTTTVAANPRAAEGTSSNFFESMNWAPWTAAAIAAAATGNAAWGAYGAGATGAGEAAAGAAGAGELAGDIGAFGGVVDAGLAGEGAALGAGSTYGGVGAGLTELAKDAALVTGATEAGKTGLEALGGTGASELEGLNLSSITGTTPEDIAALREAGYTDLANELEGIAKTVGSIGNTVSGAGNILDATGKVINTANTAKNLTGGAGNDSLGGGGATDWLKTLFPYLALGTSGLNAILGAQAAGKAAEQQTNALNYATDVANKQYEQNRADLAPWREAGKNALTSLVNKVGAGPGEFTRSPGYSFRLNEGTKALERSAAAKGGLLSGGTGKALTRYAQDYATSDYDNFLRRYYESLNPLQTLAGVGQSSSAQTAALGAQNAAQTGANAIAAGQAGAGGTINTTNAITGAANTGLNNYLLWKYMQNPQGV
ncbi:MAG: hypothetical protein EHM41_26830 [Chloroflexi bacterium]|nr:MAG: hypothetical protein EHM41_26830 [Chloroflexota bacterium]